MNISKLGKTIDTIQAGLVWFVIAIVTICIGVLLLFDVLAGTGTMMFLTGNKDWQSVVISLATTGLLFALMFIGYMLATRTQSKFIKSVGKGVVLASGVLYLTDIVFDSLLADILRYGTIIQTEDWLQWMFRGVIGGISTVGDGLAIAMIVGMPVLKAILQEALGDNIGSNPHPQQNHRPQNQGVMQNLPRRQPAQAPGQERREQGSQSQPMFEEDIPEFIKQAMMKKPGKDQRWPSA